MSAYEMLAQVQAINADLNAKASNVVLMGAGEPLLNYDNVVGFMKLLHEPDGINMSYRNMSVSTCGIVKNMYRLAEEEIPVNLCVSLHQADDELREGIMPSAKNYKIQDIMDAADSYFEKTGRRITIEYALIEGVNDSNKDIDTLIKLLHGKKYTAQSYTVKQRTGRHSQGSVQKESIYYHGICERKRYKTLL